MVGSVSFPGFFASGGVRAASRSHIAVFGSIGPSDRYSAMPSMNQSGSRSAPFCPGALLGDVVMSNWNACTSSWPIT
jgi:hypothetical protein